DLEGGGRERGCAPGGAAFLKKKMGQRLEGCGQGVFSSNWPDRAADQQHSLAPRLSRPRPDLSRRLLLFFQAEDRIRDGRVTGVQTCALPIYADLFKGSRTRHRVVLLLGPACRT